MLCLSTAGPQTFVLAEGFLKFFASSAILSDSIARIKSKEADWTP
jgi:hypothetical protein